MSRSVPPDPIHPVAVEQFTLPQEAYEPIAAALGLHSLPLLGVQLIEGEVAVYKANRKTIVSIGVNRPSIGATIAAIKAALKDARKLEASLRRFSHRVSAVDQETFEALNPAANKCLEAIGQLRPAATTRKEQLEKHRRVTPEREVLGLFFSRLRFLFKAMQDRALANGPDEMNRLLDFTRAILNAAHISWGDLDLHPGRANDLFSYNTEWPPAMRVLIATEIKRQAESSLKPPSAREP
jgi:hypothetical protein